MKYLIKTLLSAILPVAMIAVSCDKYDDAPIATRVGNLENRVTELETIVKQLNTNIGAISTTLDALKNQDKIVKVAKLPDGSGYTVEFAQSGTITIYNGTKGKDGIDGKNGKDGVSPVIAVKKDTDGQYYWTLNGEWILDNGAKIPATSKVAVPKLKIEGGKFLFSTDGTTWTEIGDAGTAGVGIIKDVKDNGDNVVFTLSDNSMISIPKTQDFALIITSSSVGVKDGQTVTIPYSITAADEGTLVKAIAEGGYTAKVNKTSNSAGNIEIMAPTPVTDASIMVIAINSKGVMSGKILEFALGQLVLVSDTVNAKAEGGEIELKINTNVDYNVLVDPANIWIKPVPATKALRTDVLKFTVDPNDTGAERRGKINVVGNNEVKVFTVIQAAKAVGVGGGVSDFETFANPVNPMKTYPSDVTTNGWTMNYGNIIGPSFWAGTVKVPSLIGNINKPGNLVSPNLTGGCGKLTLEYGIIKPYTKYNVGIKFKVEVKDNSGAVKFTREISKPQSELVPNEVITTSMDINYSGDFTITITNLCPQGMTMDVADKVCILKVEWTGFAG